MNVTPRLLASLILSIACTAAVQSEEPQPTAVIHAGTLLAVPGQAPKSKQSIVLQGERIISVLDGFVEVSTLDGNPKLIDLSDQFVLPGLMDMHVHLTGELSPTARTEALFMSASLEALRGAHFAAKTLRAGFTTVRDLGGDPEAIFALRDAIEKGYVIGPRVFAAGSSIAATGGHGDVDGYKAELLELWTPDTICDGPYDCRRATRHAIKFGADWIKITATGGVLSDTATGTDQQMTEDELREIMDTAVDSIDHGTFLDKESIKLFRRTGAFLVPTLLPGAKIPPKMEGNPFFTDAIKAKAHAAGAASMGNVGLAYEAGVKIAFGTDSAVTPHGLNGEEFALMVQAGMSEMDAIYAATVATAELLEQSEDLGTIEIGKIADIIAVNGDPLQDITELERVTVVIQAGRVIDSQ